MKKIILLLLLAAPFSGFAQFDKNEEKLEKQQRDLFKARQIKSRKVLKVTMQNTTDNNASPAPSETTEYFDRNGNHVATRNERGQISDSIYYDARGSIIKDISFEKKTIAYIIYNDKHFIQRSVIKTLNDSLLQEYVYSYDAPGANPDVKALYSKTKYTFFLKTDAHFNITEAYDADTKSKLVYQYDSKDRQTRSDSYNGDGSLIETAYIQYDAAGNQKAYLYKQGGSPDTLMQIRSDYDKLNRVTRVINDTKENYKVTTIYEYNGEGLPVQETEVHEDPKKTRISTRYTYEKY